MILQQLIQGVCPDTVALHYNYSGRGMFGKTCVAISATRAECMHVIGCVISDLREKLKEVPDGSTEEELDSIFDEAVNHLMMFKEDSMGLDVVIYWPHIKPMPTSEDEFIARWVSSSQCA